MESTEEIEKIGQNYIIKEIIGSGFSADVFHVIENETGKEYAAKVFNVERKSDCDNEINVINILKEDNNPYIIKIKESGEGDIIRKNKPKINTKYYILEYASFGNIFDYIFWRKSGFGEFYSKVIFSKIVEGVKFCHDHNICHRDLKLENTTSYKQIISFFYYLFYNLNWLNDNILLTDDFCPKISDFGFACINAPNLKDKLGTSVYKPPEIRQGKRYDGKKADIFCLGSILIILVSGKRGFIKARILDKYYQYIFQKNEKLYWQLVEPNMNQVKLSSEFKDLYIKMITYEPDKRITAEEILNHPWFNEITEIKKNPEKMEEIEKDIKSKFTDVEEIVKKANKKELEKKINANKENKGASDTRSIKVEKIYFNDNQKPEIIDTCMNMNNCIIIKNLLNPVDFMNSLHNQLLNEFGSICLIEDDKEKLELNVFFEEEEEKEEIPEEIKEELKKLGINEDMEDDERLIELTIEIKLYKYNDDYILRFIQKKGDRYYFLDKYAIISKLVENIIS